MSEPCTFYDSGHSWLIHSCEPGHDGVPALATEACTGCGVTRRRELVDDVDLRLSAFDAACALLALTWGIDDRPTSEMVGSCRVARLLQDVLAEREGGD